MPRIKSYSAESGYAYQYVFSGMLTQPGRMVFMFDATHDRGAGFEVRVVVSDACFTRWERPLNDTERYAVAKMALFEAFDQRPSPLEMRAPVIVDPEQALRIIRTLDL